MNIDIKELIKNNEVRFYYYRANHLYYTINHHNRVYTFPVPIEDIGEATFWYKDKAIYFMRYIRKAMNEGTFTEEV